MLGVTPLALWGSAQVLMVLTSSSMVMARRANIFLHRRGDNITTKVASQPRHLAGRLWSFADLPLQAAAIARSSAPASLANAHVRERSASAPRAREGCAGRYAPLL